MIFYGSLFFIRLVLPSKCFNFSSYLPSSSPWDWNILFLSPWDILNKLNLTPHHHCMICPMKINYHQLSFTLIILLSCYFFLGLTVLTVQNICGAFHQWDCHQKYWKILQETTNVQTTGGKMFPLLTHLYLICCGLIRCLKILGTISGFKWHSIFDSVSL